MPGMDGTGPYGAGPVGFGRGPCGRGIARRAHSHSIGRGFDLGLGNRCIYRVPYRDPDLTKEERLKILRAEKEDIERMLKELEG